MFTNRRFFNKEGHFKALVNLLFHSFHISLFHMKAHMYIYTHRDPTLNRSQLTLKLNIQ